LTLDVGVKGRFSLSRVLSCRWRESSGGVAWSNTFGCQLDATLTLCSTRDIGFRWIRTVILKLSAIFLYISQASFLPLRGAQCSPVLVILLVLAEQPHFELFPFLVVGEISRCRGLFCLKESIVTILELSELCFEQRDFGLQCLMDQMAIRRAQFRRLPSRGVWDRRSHESCSGRCDRNRLM
jgi:hypothetical protein